MDLLKLRCEVCGVRVLRSQPVFCRNGPHVYCDRQCTGIARRKFKTDTQKKSEKALYDTMYRARNLTSIKSKKRDYFKRTYDPKQAAVVRRKRMPIHVEYCRRPEYRKKKSAYDETRRDRLQFGEFAESAKLLRQIESEVEKRMSKYNIRLQQGTLTKAQTRKRALHEKNTRR